MANRSVKNCLNELTNEQIEFLRKTIEKHTKVNVISKFHKKFNCWINVDYIAAVATKYQLTTLGYGGHVDEILTQYYGRVTTSEIVELLDKKYHLGLSIKEVTNHCINVLGFEMSKAKAVYYYQLFDFDQNKKVFEGSLDEIANYLNIKKSTLMDGKSVKKYWHAGDMIYRIKEVSIR